jgi:hypothetical protein
MTPTAMLHANTRFLRVFVNVVAAFLTATKNHILSDPVVRIVRLRGLSFGRLHECVYCSQPSAMHTQVFSVQSQKVRHIIPWQRGNMLFMLRL